MFKMVFGFLVGTGLSVMHYDYGISPHDLIQIVIKNSNDVIEEVQEIQSEEPSEKGSFFKSIFSDDAFHIEE